MVAYFWIPVNEGRYLWYVVPTYLPKSIRETKKISKDSTFFKRKVKSKLLLKINGQSKPYLDPHQKSSNTTYIIKFNSLQKLRDRVSSTIY